MSNNLENLSREYIGRGIVIGQTNEEISFVAYILTGRSESSKARILRLDDRCGVVYTEPTDRKILEKGSQVLLLYPAIMTFNNGIAVSNGAQTKLPFNQIMRFPDATNPKSVLMNALEASFFEYDSELGLIDITSFEPDKPNYTPRITGCVIEDMGAFAIARNRGKNRTEKEYFEFKLIKGKSKLIMTYDGVDTGREPLHSFSGEPLDLKLTGKTEEEIAKKVREAINPLTFIAVAVQFADNRKKSHIINLHNAVQ